MEPHLSNDIEKLATATYGTLFNEKSLPKQALYPLRDAGYIHLERGTKEAGRGAKPFLVSTTDKFVVDVITPLIEQLEQQIQADLRPLLRKPLAEILDEIESSDRHIRGLALEALAFKLMRLVDLTYITTRLRGSATGGAEVDLIFEGTLRFFRAADSVQEYCPGVTRRCGQRSGPDPFPQEQRDRHRLNRRDRPEARRYANKIMTDSNLCVVMVDGTDLSKIEQRPAAILDVFNREARHAMDLKKLDL